jgi:AcrR family transcriptional regulator
MIVDRMRELMADNAGDEKLALKQLARESGVSKSALYRQWQQSRQRGHRQP